MIICFKDISEEGFLCNSNIKIINASLKALKKVPKQKVKLNPYKNQIYIANPKSFWDQFFSPSLFIYKRHFFMLSILLQLHLTRHSGKQSPLKDTQRVLEHSRHSESTRTLRHLSTWTLAALKHLCTRALKALGHSRPSGSLGLEAL